MSTLNDAVLRLKAIISAIEGREGLDELDPISRDILMYVVQAFISEQLLRASDIAANAKFGSPATIYNRLAKLHEFGWTRSTLDPNDGRTRYISPTTKTQNAFARMSAAAEKHL